MIHYSEIPLEEDISDFLILWPYFKGKSEGLNRSGYIVCLFKIASKADMIKLSQNRADSVPLVSWVFQMTKIWPFIFSDPL